MRAIWTILLCISFLDIRGQRIAKIVYPLGAGTIQQEGFTVNYTIGEAVTGYTALEGTASMFVGFLGPVFSSISTASQDEQPEAFKVFPNPFTENFYIKPNIPGDKLRYLLSDLNGRIILKGSFSNPDQAIPAGLLKSGIYILTLTRAGGHFAHYKLIKL